MKLNKKNIKHCALATLFTILLLANCFAFGLGIYLMPRHKYSHYEVERERQIQELGYYSSKIEYPLTEEDKQKLEEYEFYVIEWYWCLAILVGSTILGGASLIGTIYNVEEIQ